jgi:hypothetical protein
MKPGWLENLGAVRPSHIFFSRPVPLRRIQTRLIRIGILCAIFSFPFSVWGQILAATTDSQGSQAKTPSASVMIPSRCRQHAAA